MHLSYYIALFQNALLAAHFAKRSILIGLVVLDIREKMMSPEATNWFRSTPEHSVNFMRFLMLLTL